SKFTSNFLTMAILLSNPIIPKIPLHARDDKQEINIYYENNKYDVPLISPTEYFPNEQMSLYNEDINRIHTLGLFGSDDVGSDYHIEVSILNSITSAKDVVENLVEAYTLDEYGLILGVNTMNDDHDQDKKNSDLLVKNATHIEHIKSTLLEIKNDLSEYKKDTKSGIKDLRNEVTESQKKLEDKLGKLEDKLEDKLDKIDVAHSANLDKMEGRLNEKISQISKEMNTYKGRQFSIWSGVLIAIITAVFMVALQAISSKLIH
ncbi:MAG: hypothetical protein OWR52_04135, partial [Acidibacillus sp.]|nr:hypothetical protein [Acidibacillus sp.]